MVYGHFGIGIVLFVFFLTIDVILYAFNAAIRTLSPNDIAESKEGKAKYREMISKILESPSRFNDTVNIIVYITNIIAGSYILGSLARRVIQSVNGDKTWIYIVLAAAMILVFIIFGVIIPEKCGRRKPVRTAIRLVKYVRFLMLVLSPVVFATTMIAKGILRIFGIKNPDAEENVTEEEIITMVNEGQEQGVLEAGEAEMITNIFELGDKHAGDIMTHRSNIEAVESTITLDNFIQNHIEGKYSRFPVYEGDIDNIVGTIHIRDALIFYRNIPNRKKLLKDVKGLLRKPYMVPETMDIDDMLKDMQEKKIHMGIVVDEYGQTAGIVSMEDIIEEIVGNILDEYDDEEEVVEYAGDDTYVVDGLTDIEDINSLLGIKIESDGFETLNGFLISKLGRIASENETEVIEAYGFSFKILEVTGNVIRKVEITKIDKKEGIDDEQLQN